ncbi:rRNA pseudouridine synthase [Pseudomarimonas arenosa]|uniref:Dual-specificity RNA pseudouridine synthase RluF n=1 Tax=Pseudomarimonas arenosa TaxID=2774145 RepID=A0AAW3ZFH5_9GAMM|nr:rRNA pseudouridine synthase [Pseudomarimonas arenosa]MBD8524648.1 rRNA pseudouridine synthase [Pseudomarimonas arenosa]
MTDPIRLARRVAEIQRCTRAEAEQLIRNGWVSVNGHVVETPQLRVADERVAIDPNARIEAVEPATLLLHKPAGVDPIDGPKPALALISPDSHWSDDQAEIRPLQRHFQHLQPLATLENEASGLMVFSQDGRIVRRLTEDCDQIEHEYVVDVEGSIAPYGLHRLAHGLRFEGRPLPACKVSWQSEARLRFAIKAARPGQLRDMCAQVGLEVKSIRRLRIGRIALGKGPAGAMPAGQWRYLPVGERF